MREPPTILRLPGEERPYPARPVGSPPVVQKPPAEDPRLSPAYYLMILCSVALLAFGLVMLLSTSSVPRLFDEQKDPLAYVRSQGVMAAIGLLALVLLSRIDYRRWRRLGPLALALTVTLLLVTHIPGVARSAGGATRWISLGPVALQPSEVAKLAILLVSAQMLSAPRVDPRHSRTLLWPLGPIVLLVCLLIFEQPDLGTALLVAGMALGLLLVAGLRLGVLAGLVLSGVALAGMAILTAQYRQQRFLAFLDPFADPTGKGWQLVQAQLGMGSGGLLGVGPGRSVQKFSYLYAADTDMILAVVGEELGLLGVGVLVLLFGAFTLAAWRIARRCADPFGKYLVTGAMLLIAGQAVLNMAGVMAALPLTGVPLPFISFARTNLLVVLVAVGLILSVARFGPCGEGMCQPRPARTARRAGPHLREPLNVHYLDGRRRDGGARSPRPRGR